MELRPYQLSGAQQVIDIFANGGRHVILTLPTGGGKTAIAIAIIKSFVNRGRNVLILVHRLELVRQISRQLTHAGISHDTLHGGKKFGGTSPQGPCVMVASIESIGSAGYPFLGSDDLIVTDECHRANATKIFRHYEGSYRLGLTATPYHMQDGAVRTLSDTYNDIVIAATPLQLLSQGYICPIKIFAPALTEDASKTVRNKDGWSWEQLRDRVMDGYDLVGDVVSTYINSNPPLRHKTIAYTRRVDEARALAERFNNAGLKSMAMDGSMSLEQRDDILNAYRESDGRFILCNADLLTEGLDIPETQRIIMLRATDSPIVYLQQVGRAVRPYPGKECAELYDHAGNCFYHGHPYCDRTIGMDPGIKNIGRPVNPEETSAWRCSQCYRVFQSAQKKCPNCNAEGNSRSSQKMLRVDDSGRLVEFDPLAEEAARRANELIQEQKSVNNSRIRQLFGHYMRQGLTSNQARPKVMKDLYRFKADQNLRKVNRQWQTWQEFMQTKTP